MLPTNDIPHFWTRRNKTNTKETYLYNRTLEGYPINTGFNPEVMQSRNERTERRC